MNDQGQSAAAIPVWDAGGPPVPNADGTFPSDRDNPNAAIPVWRVAGTPAQASVYPNDQGYVAQNPPQGAIPVRIVSKPTPNADGTFPADRGNANAAIPVWFVPEAPADAPPYPAARNAAAGAWPVWVVA